MRKTLIGIIVFGFFLTGYGQKDPIKFGDIPKEVLAMTSFSADPSAEAVVIADYGVSEIIYNQTRGWELFFERTRRIKILTEQGKRWADFTIPLYEDGDLSERLIFFKGATANLENGKVIESKLKSDALFHKKYDRNLTYVTVTMPNVKAGAVIDISYKVKSDFFVNFQDWDFQSTIPTLWSEYRAIIPEYFYYEKYTQGYLEIPINEQGGSQRSITLFDSGSAGLSGGLIDRSQASLQRNSHSEMVTYKLNTYRWAIPDVPAFRDEPYMTSRLDFISRISFELSTITMPGQAPRSYMGSWTEISKRFADSDDFFPVIRGSGFLKGVVEELTASATSAPERIQAIHRYVVNTITWNGEYRRYPGKSLRQVHDDKAGSSVEVNLLFASMLEKAGINVVPVFLSTREHGFIRESTPAATQFNNMVCLAKWDDKQVLLDATTPFLAAGSLPANCLNGKGMAVEPNSFFWVPLNAPTKSKVVVNVDLELSKDGVLFGQVSREDHGYNASDERGRYFEFGEPGYVDSLRAKQSWGITKSEFTNARDVSQPLKQKHEVSIADHVTSAGEVMYLNPFVTDQVTSNPFKSETRQYPVYFVSAFDRVYIIKLKIPEGYVAEELPATKNFALPGNGARYALSSSINGNTVNVTSVLSVNKALFPGTEYETLREFYNQLVAKQAEQIVIKKK